MDLSLAEEFISSVAISTIETEFDKFRKDIELLVDILKEVGLEVMTK